jgi:acetolactate synthase-1/2/3 large subunit
LATARYGSDVAVDALHSLGVRYLALNPGASFRGLHDSLVNYGGNRPQVLEVPHEKVAVGIAHGYAKASGEPMGVVTHDLVVLGGAGPMDQAKRRPWIDWVHTANVQNSSVRDFTKWDDHPYSAEAIPESFARAAHHPA